MAIWISFLILVAPHARAEKSVVGPPASCLFAYRAVGGVRQEDAPAFRALRTDLPEIKDPLQFIGEFGKRRSDWNLLHPTDRNNFPMPEMSNGVRQLAVSLRKVKRPPENRIAAETFLRELDSLKSRGYPYRESLLKIHEALDVVALKHPLTIEQARAVEKNSGPAAIREKLNPRKMFSGEDAERRAEFEQMMETEIFFPTGHEQSVEGIAESFVLGLRPLQMAERAARLDGLNMTGLHRYEHDVAHIAIQNADPVNRSITALPLESRVGIVRDIENLATPREQTLARFSLYQTAHEWGNDSFIPRTFNTEAQQMVSEEYARSGLPGTITPAEIRWLQTWYRIHVGRRVYESQSPVR